MKASMRCSAAMAALLACVVLAALAQPGGKVKVGYCGPLKDIVYGDQWGQPYAGL